MNIFILNNKAFERRHREIYGPDDQLDGFAIYDYDQKQIRRNHDFLQIEAGDLALVFGKDRTVREVYRVTGVSEKYAPDVKKEVFVVYGEYFGSLDQRVVYSKFITDNKLECTRVNNDNNFTIGMLVARCTGCQEKSLDQLIESWKTT